MDRRIRRAGGQRAASGAGTATRHGRVPLVPGRRHEDDTDIEHLHRELVLEVSSGEQRRSSQTHVDDLDRQCIEDARGVLGHRRGGAARRVDRRRRHPVVVIAPQGDRAVHRGDDPRLGCAAAAGWKDLQSVEARERSRPEHRHERDARHGKVRDDGPRRMGPERLDERARVEEEEIGVCGDHPADPRAVRIVQGARRGIRIAGHEVLAADDRARERRHDGWVVGGPAVDDGDEHAGADDAIEKEVDRSGQHVVVDVVVWKTAGPGDERRRVHEIDLLGDRQDDRLQRPRRGHDRVLVESPDTGHRRQLPAGRGRQPRGERVDVVVQVRDLTAERADHRGDVTTRALALNDDGLDRALLGCRGFAEL